MTKTGTQLIVVDAGPIIHLDELEALSALVNFDEILLTQTVWQEIRNHRSPDLTPFPIRFVPDPKPDSLVVNLAKTFLLHAGEKPALSLCRQFPEAIFATDDTAARLAGNQIGLRVYGSVGLLLRAMRVGEIPKKKLLHLLREIPQKSTLFIKASLLSTVIREVEGFQR